MTMLAINSSFCLRNSRVSKVQGYKSYITVYLGPDIHYYCSMVHIWGPCFPYQRVHVFHIGCVAANHENDTCFGNGLVMGFADCVNYAGLVVWYIFGVHVFHIRGSMFSILVVLRPIMKMTHVLETDL